LGKHDIVGADGFLDKAFGVWDYLLVAGDGCWRREGGDDIGVSSFQVPEVMKIAVGKDNEAAVF